MKKIILGTMAVTMCVALTACGTSANDAALNGLGNQLDHTANTISNIQTVNPTDINVTRETLETIANKDVALYDNIVNTQQTLMNEEYYKMDILNKTAKIKNNLGKDIKLSKTQINAVKELTNNLTKYTNSINYTRNEMSSTVKSIVSMKKNIDKNADKINAKLNRLACNSNARSSYYENILNTLEHIESYLCNTTNEAKKSSTQTDLQTEELNEIKNENKITKNIDSYLPNSQQNSQNENCNNCENNENNQNCNNCNENPNDNFNKPLNSNNFNRMNGFAYNAYPYNYGANRVYNGFAPNANYNRYPYSGNNPYVNPYGYGIGMNYGFNANGFNRFNRFNPMRNTDTYAPMMRNIDTYQFNPNTQNPNLYAGLQQTTLVNSQPEERLKEKETLENGKIKKVEQSEDLKTTAVEEIFIDANKNNGNETNENMVDENKEVETSKFETIANKILAEENKKSENNLISEKEESKKEISVKNEKQIKSTSNFKSPKIRIVDVRKQNDDLRQPIEGHDVNTSIERLIKE